MCCVAFASNGIFCQIKELSAQEPREGDLMGILVEIPKCEFFDEIFVLFS